MGYNSVGDNVGLSLFV